MASPPRKQNYTTILLSDAENVTNYDPTKAKKCLLKIWNSVPYSKDMRVSVEYEADMQDTLTKYLTICGTNRIKKLFHESVQPETTNNARGIGCLLRTAQGFTHKGGDSMKWWSVIALVALEAPGFTEIRDGSITERLEGVKQEFKDSMDGKHWYNTHDTAFDTAKGEGFLKLYGQLWR